MDVKCLSESGIPSVKALEDPMAMDWANAYKLNSVVEELIEVNPEEMDFLKKRVEELQTWEWLINCDLFFLSISF